MAIKLSLPYFETVLRLETIKPKCATAYFTEKCGPFQSAEISVSNREDIYIDVFGRYKAYFDFDRIRDKGSHLKGLRKSAFFTGLDEGGDLPLYKKTNVILAFLYRDYDNPIILGAVAPYEKEAGLSERDAKKIIFKVKEAGGCS